MASPTRRSSFTLIELLIVVAVIAVLATIIVLLINPTELLRQARDSSRLSDMKTLQKAVQLYEWGQGGSLGTADTLYISVPDPSATSTAGDRCQGLGLSSLPSGWSWHCAASSTYKAVDGTGWIPLDLTRISSGSPLATLPVDPTNTTSSGLYYSYVGSGDPYELTANMESGKYGLGGSHDAVTTDGGQYPDLYETGTDLTLMPIDYNPSLVGYWKFDEGTGTIAYDSTSFGRNIGAAHPPASWVTGKVGEAIETTGDTDGSWRYYPGQFPTYNPITIMAWINSASTTQNNRYVVEFGNGSYTGTRILQKSNQVLEAVLMSGATTCGTLDSPTGTISAGIWQFIAVTYDGTTETLYNDGVAVASQNVSCSLYSQTNLYINWSSTCGSNCSFDGATDEVRIYNSALSASEIQAIYKAEQ